MDRRQFLHHGLTATTLAASHRLGLGASPDAAARNEFCYFTKHLQALDFETLAEVSARMGVDGVEVPVRPKGHIEPERVEEELPQLVQALKAQNLNLSILTSGINEVSAEQRTEAVLRTAAKLGVKRFRMLYYKYDLDQPLWPQLEGFRARYRDLVALCREIGIQPLYQNHSGAAYAGAALWDVDDLMREFPESEAAFAFDIRHATVEGGLAWPQHAALARQRMGAVYFKDFQWEGRKPINCPLGEGQVSPDFAKRLVKDGYSGPISLHLEYLTGDPRDAAVLESFETAHTRDFAVLKGWLGLA
ncbi:MAG: TIM barrel protein [Verrucomicrobiales bacterium]|nr:TIM barrel protein [Verrucomicrobiales bacterium]